MLLDWKAMTPKERRLHEPRCVELAESLGSVLDEDKVLAKKMLIQARTVIDTRGQENIGKTRAQASGAAFRAEKRADNIEWIWKYVDRRKASLMLARRDNLVTLNRALSDLDRMYEILAMKNPRENEFHGLGSNLVSELRKTHDLPWRRSFRNTAFDIEAAMMSVRVGRAEHARRSVFLSLASLYGLEVYTDVSDFQLRLTIATERRPRVEVELGDLHEDLRGLIDATSPGNGLKYKTRVVRRMREGLQTAYALWNQGKPFPAVREALRLGVRHV